YEAARAARPECDDVVLWTERGEITEALTSNIVVELDGQLWTPPVSSGLLAGTFRGQLLAQGEIQERIIGVEDLRRSTHIWLINSVRRWQTAVLSDTSRQHVKTTGTAF
ncbi:MAG: aminotransferase class IV, partial [Anaerolineae bacterium]